MPRTPATLALVAAIFATAAAPAAATHPSPSGPVFRHADPAGSFDPDPAQPPLARVPGRRPLLLESCRTPVNRADDATHSPYLPDTPVIKVVYAYPSDVGNRLDRPLYPDASPQTVGDRIQGEVKALFDFIAAESGQTESLRFDVGTSTGPDCLDIQTIALPRTRAEYRQASPDTFHAIQDDVRARLGEQPGTRNYLVYADGITDFGNPSHETAGIAEQLDSDSADGSTSHNLGGLWAIIFNFYAYTVPLHELTHTLGAVQPSAPHGTQGRHCSDGYDVMCYADGHSPLTIVCRDPYTERTPAWDCNKDDYYNPSPPPGSYLDTHWNVHRSVFMCPLAQCAPTDATGPTVTFDAAPARRTRKKNARFRFSSSEGAVFRCAIDRRRQRACRVDRRTPYVYEGSFTARRLDPGRHRFRVWATDAAGNRGKGKVRFRIVGG